MLKSILATTTVTATLVGFAAAPAHAVPKLGVDSCSASAPGANSTDTCIFVATGGVYRLSILSDARFAWASVLCQPFNDYMRVEVWDVDGGYAYTVDGLAAGVCVLTVSAGANGPASANVVKIV